MIDILDFNEPFYLMLCGLPASGKTTFRKKFLDMWSEEYGHFSKKPSILSSDDEIEYYAKLQEITYNQSFQKHIKDVEKHVNEMFDVDLECSNNIIDDRTNLSVKSRKKKLVKIPKTYKKYAIFLETPDEETWKNRLNRPGKTIPENILNSMKETLEIPTVSEGFKQVWIRSIED